MGRYSLYFTTWCYTEILLFMAVRISKLVLQQFEKGFVCTVEHTGGFSQSVQRKLSTTRDVHWVQFMTSWILNGKSLQRYVQLSYFTVSLKFQHNSLVYWYISTWHQFENSIMAEFGLLGFATFTASHMQFSLLWNWRPSNCCFSNPNNLLWGVMFSVTMQPHTAHGPRVIAVVALGSSGTSTLLFVLILQ